MPDEVDLVNERAARDEEARSQGSSVESRYVIAYCSGDGDKLTTEDFTGTKQQRFAFMKDLGVDPDLTNNWAFGQWSVKELLWIVAGGDGNMKKKMHEHFASLKQRSR